MDERFLRWVPVATALLTMVAAWFLATSSRVSYTALLWFSGACVGLGALLLLRQRWLAAVGALIAALLIYVGRGAGGISGITLFVLGAGLAAVVVAATGRGEVWRRSESGLTET